MRASRAFRWASGWILGLGILGIGCGEPAPSEPEHAPRIEAFTASPASLEEAGKVLLGWESQHATEVALFRDGDPVDPADPLPTSGSIEVEVEESTDFQLVATGPGGPPDTAELRVEVTASGPIDAPTIGSFEAPPVVGADEEGVAWATLRWSAVDGFDELRLERSPGEGLALSPVAEGSVEVQLQQDTSFTLVASGPGGEARAQAQTRIAWLPRIERFEVDRSWIGVGEEVWVEWETEGATRVELWANGDRIEALEPDAFAGSLALPLLLDTTLELRAFNELDVRVEARAEVLIGPPVVTSFSGDRTELWLGESVHFEWQVQGASSLILSTEGSELPICLLDDPAELAVAGCTWTPEVPGLYPIVLSAQNASGLASRDWSLYVGTGPRIDRFELIPSAINRGDPLELRWSARPDPDGEEPTLTLLDEDDAPLASFEGLEGLEELHLELEAGLRSFILRAQTSAPLSSPAEALAEVRVHELPTVQLEANPEVYDDLEHDRVLLSWSSAHASSLVLYRLEGEEEIEVFQVPEAILAAGNFTVIPAGVERYRMVATNPLGATSAAEATIELAPLEVIAFEADDEEVVAGQPVELEWVVRSAESITLDIFDGSYVREETTDPFIDVEPLGGALLPLTSDCYPEAPLHLHGCAVVGFGEMPFRFGGTDYFTARVYSNGVISFQTSHLSSASAQNYSFPTPSGQRHVHLAPFWDALRWDESRYPTGNIFVLQQGEPGERSVIIQWKDVSLAALEEASLDFQVILHESGDFEYRYGALTTKGEHSPLVEGSSATIGYQLPSQSAWDMRQYVTTLSVRGSLDGRTFTYRRPPQVENRGRYLWHPYATDDTITATLHASRGAETISREVTVQVHRRPEVRLPIRPQAPVLAGTEFRIGWSTLLASSVEVLDEEGTIRCAQSEPGAVAEGFCNLQEEEEGLYTYRVRAIGALGFVTERSVEVAIYEPFGIVRFEADRERLEYGELLTLEWETFNASKILLFANGVPIFGDSASKPGVLTLSELEADTTFVLRATNAVGVSVESSLEVEVWKIRLELGVSSGAVRPGQPVSIEVEAVTQAGVPAQAVYGIYPMRDVSGSTAFVDLSDVGGAIQIAPTNTSNGMVELQFPLGFVFPYFGEIHQSARVFVDGILSFAPNATFSNSNRPLPDGSTATFGRIHLAPFWDDVHLRASGEMWSGLLDPDTFAIQWSKASLATGSNNTAEYDLNFQVVLHRSGAFEFRYGKMAPPAEPTTACRPAGCANEANASSATIGYQMPEGLSGFTLHHGGTSSAEDNPTFPGGLSNRAFRYEPIVGKGTVVLHPTVTERYHYCVRVDEGPVCRSVEILAEFGLDHFEVSADRIDLGDPVTLSWRSHGGTSLRILDQDDRLLYETSDPAEIDAGSWAATPQRHTTYRLEVRAATHLMTRSRRVEVERVRLSASAPQRSAPAAPIELSWTLHRSDPSIQPILIAPLQELQGAPFSALDLSQDPQAQVLHGSGVATAVAPLIFEEDFSFDYLGTPMREVHVASVGYLSFDMSSTAGSATNTALPNAATAPKRVHIAPFWDALHTRQSGRVLAKRIDADTYVIQWSHMSLTSGSSDTNEYDLNFLVVLRRSGEFEFRYGAMAPPQEPSAACIPQSCVNEANGSSATIGYQDPTGTLGHQLHFASVPSEERAIPGGLSGRSWRFQRITASGSMQLAPWDTTVYELCALDPSSGDTFCAEAVEVEVPWGIVAFAPVPDAPLRGAALDLEWEVVGLESLRLFAGEVEIGSWSGSIPSTGRETHHPTADTVYRLVGSSLGRTVEVEREVRIRTFSLNVGGPPGPHLPGADVPISWGATVHEPGTLQLVTPMLSLPSSPGAPGAYEDVRDLPGATRVTTNNANGYANLTIPFPFPYFGATYTQARVWVDGYLSFDQSGTSGVSGNVAFPSNTTANRRIHLAPFWDDLFMRGNDSIWTYQPDAQTFVIQWSNFNLASGSNSPNALFDLNFQVVLHADGKFDYRYGRMAPPPTPAPNPGCFPCVEEVRGRSATIGYQTVDGELGHNLHFGDDRFSFPGGLEGRGFRYTPAASWSGLLTAGASRSYEICGVLGSFRECVSFQVPSVADPGELAITELMLAPAGGAASQWFEVRNLARRPLDLQGFVIRSGAGSFTVTGSLPLGPGELAVLAASELEGADRSYGASLSLDDSQGTLEILAGASTIASVAWGPSWSIPAGEALALDPRFHLRGEISHDDFTRWCPAGSGTPKALGFGCANDRYDVDPAASGSFIDIRASGRKVHAFSAGSQVVRLDVPDLGWPFFEQRIRRIWAGSDGWISFAAEAPGGINSFSPASFPRNETHQPAGPLLGVFWGSLSCVSTEFDCAFHYDLLEVGGAEVLVAQWSNFRLGPSPGSVTVQAQIWEDGDIRIVFDDVYSLEGPSTAGWRNYHGQNAWIGIEALDRSDFLSGHLRELIDLDHRTFHFRRK